jgi:hypothetical protein
MKTAFIVLTFLILIAVNASMACSVYVDSDYQKNILADHAASYLALDPATITSTTITGYSKLFSDEDPESFCPQALQTQATVSFTYKPSKAENCNAEATVVRQTYIGEDPTISFETMAVSEVTASCSITSIRMDRPMRPLRRIPRKPVKPVRP